MTIKIEDNIDDLTAISLVKQVIEQGKISNNGNSYCYLTEMDYNEAKGRYIYDTFLYY